MSSRILWRLVRYYTPVTLQGFVWRILENTNYTQHTLTVSPYGLRHYVVCLCKSFIKTCLDHMSSTFTQRGKYTPVKLNELFNCDQDNLKPPPLFRYQWCYYYYSCHCYSPSNLTTVVVRERGLSLL